jgi:hypothetical protein
VIGIGLPGSVALDFSRDAASADVAVRSAIEAVMTAIPDAKLTKSGWFREDMPRRRKAINNGDWSDGLHRSE